jgi:hypothetical protein
LNNIASIIDRNAQAAQRNSRGIGMDLAHFLLHYDRARSILGENEDEGTEGPSQCANQ